MFEDLIEKLKTSIEELRKKLPGGGDDDEYEDDDDDYEEKYHEDGDEDDDDGKTVKVQITDLLQDGEASSDEEDVASPKEKTKKIYTDEDGDDEDDEDEDEDEDADAAAQKRKKIIIYAVAVLLIGFLLKDEFMPSEPEPAAVNFVKPKRKKRKKRKVPKTNVETAKAKEEAPAAPTTPTEPTTPAPTTPPAVDVPPETAVGLPEEKKPEPEMPKVEPTKEPMVEAPKEETPPPKVEEIPKMGEVTGDELSDDTGLDIQLGEETAPKKMEKPAEDMASKIDKKLEYIAPPNYERSGRGLIYNCVGKHWACVDKFSYLTCKENSRWSSQNNKKPECMIKNVYASVEDCGIIQKHYIESSETTAFCDSVPGAVQEQAEDEVSEEIDLLE